MDPLINKEDVEAAAEYIRTHKYKAVGLQFPDRLLPQSVSPPQGTRWTRLHRDKSPWLLRRLMWLARWQCSQAPALSCSQTRRSEGEMIHYYSSIILILVTSPLFKLFQLLCGRNIRCSCQCRLRGMLLMHCLPILSLFCRQC